MLEGLARSAAAHGQLEAGPADHEHTPSGVTVVHNGVGSVDPLDALPADVLLPPAPLAADVLQSEGA